MKIGINGFGRIGRAVFKICLERGMDVVAINDVHGIKDAEYLLKYDTVYGRYKESVRINGNSLDVGGRKIEVLNERKPEKLPWKKLGVRIVVESTGAFTNVKDASMHLKAGAEKVVITAPFKGAGKIIVPGVNDSLLKKSDKIISVASCTTNCLAPIVKVLDESFGIKSAFMTT